MDDIFKDVDLEKLYKSLTEDNKRLLLYYLLDYEIDLDNNGNALFNEVIIEKVMRENYHTIKDAIEGDGEEYFHDADKDIESLVLEYKKLREKKLKRILKANE